MTPFASALSRRALLAGGAGLLTAAGLPRTARSGENGAARGSADARNLIFLVSDGASTGTLTLADAASRLRRGHPCWWTRLWTEPGARRAMMSTAAWESLVTDSAAASSAWGIGRQVRNGSVNVLRDGGTPTPILVAAKAAGYRTGLVTTTRLTDATPAGFVANVPKRTLEQVVAVQMLERGVDLLLGGGAAQFTAEALERARATVCRSAAELRAASPRLPEVGPFVGLFASSSMAFELDRDDSQPSLAEMTLAALERLAAATESTERGFVVQIEGARIDHAAHANDAAALVSDQLAFDDAVGVALAFARERGGRRGDTLVIVTTDHGNANPGLTVYGKAGETGLLRLLDARHSFEWMLERLGGVGDARERADDLPTVVRDATGIDLSPDEVAWVRRRLLERQPVNGFGEADSTESALGAVLANHYGVAFISVNHTSDLVDCAAWGPGADRLDPVIANTDLHTVMCGALGLRAG